MAHIHITVIHKVEGMTEKWILNDKNKQDLEPDLANWSIHGAKCEQPPLWDHPGNYMMAF